MTLSTSSPQTESWFGLTTRSDFHPNTPAPITTFSITSLPPDAELISHAQHKQARQSNQHHSTAHPKLFTKVTGNITSLYHLEQETTTSPTGNSFGPNSATS
ncbi:unnamed protein product [Ambrosiozyma monospora]|uniref:Unnamed protein product n=1 Tax=Ambrosiozyma monospora TaxID=43982 RepID=A0ACB5U0G0_AMBMO|nr:unnamed protein product [Ambrosiozyma monospora]